MIVYDCLWINPEKTQDCTHTLCLVYFTMQVIQPSSSARQTDSGSSNKFKQLVHLKPKWDFLSVIQKNPLTCVYTFISQYRYCMSKHTYGTNISNNNVDNSIYYNWYIKKDINRELRYQGGMCGLVKCNTGCVSKYEVCCIRQRVKCITKFTPQSSD